MIFIVRIDPPNTTFSFFFFFFFVKGGRTGGERKWWKWGVVNCIKSEKRNLTSYSNLKYLGDAHVLL